MGVFIVELAYQFVLCLDGCVGFRLATLEYRHQNEQPTLNGVGRVDGAILLKLGELENGSLSVDDRRYWDVPNFAMDLLMECILGYLDFKVPVAPESFCPAFVPIVPRPKNVVRILVSVVRMWLAVAFLGLFHH